MQSKRPFDTGRTSLPAGWSMSADVTPTAPHRRPSPSTACEEVSMPRCIRMCLVAVAALALAGLPLSAQKVLDLHVGVSIATFGGSDAGTPGSRTGVSAGASLTVPASNLLGIQVGAGYVQKGAKDNIEGVTLTLAMDYIEVPVLLRIGIPSTSSLSAHIVVGPAVAFRAGCAGKGAQGGVKVSVDCDQLAQLGVDLVKTDVGAMGGLGLDIATHADVKVFVDALYTFGLRSIESGTHTKNRAFTLQAGLGVPLG
jgi:hypothetical protein